MRSNPADYVVLTPPTLADALALLRDQPDQHTPLAGGTEPMVAFNTGRLAPRSLVSINHLRELRFINVAADTIELGSGTTFTDLRRHPAVQEDLPLLAQAASWTGSVATQNRGTLGGNLVNASPAADSSPALLVYDASLTLVSAGGTRALPYTDFHLGYKRTALRSDELLYSVTLKRNWQSHTTCIRKVGTRNAQAISKVVLAARAQTESRNDTAIVTDIRISGASLADRPIRCFATELALLHQPLTPAAIAGARSALLAEVRPIDDIRSTARYRSAVAANLLEDFLHSLI